MSEGRPAFAVTLALHHGDEQLIRILQGIDQLTKESDGIGPIRDPVVETKHYRHEQAGPDHRRTVRKTTEARRDQ